MPLVPVLHSEPLFAWKTRSKPPIERAAMLGLVFAAIPRPVSAEPAQPVYQRLPVFACLVTLLLQPAKPSLIVFDEPELGLHPAAIVQLAELLQVVSHESQIIIATQSVTLLDQFAAEDVIVVERDNDESTFRRLGEDQLRSWLEDYSLGELWLKNFLGGQPE